MKLYYSRLKTILKQFYYTEIGTNFVINATPSNHFDDNANGTYIQPCVAQDILSDLLTKNTM